MFSGILADNMAYFNSVDDRLLNDSPACGYSHKKTSDFQNSNPDSNYKNMPGRGLSVIICTLCVEQKARL